jgi:hypothetical protein
MIRGKLSSGVIVLIAYSKKGVTVIVISPHRPNAEHYKYPVLDLQKGHYYILTITKVTWW